METVDLYNTIMFLFSENQDYTYRQFSGFLGRLGVVISNGSIFY